MAREAGRLMLKRALMYQLLGPVIYHLVAACKAAAK
jgi:hypothetical protein